MFFTFFKLYKEPATLLKVILLSGCFSRFLNCTNSTKSRKTSHIEYEEKVESDRFCIMGGDSEILNKLSINQLSTAEVIEKI